MEKGIKRLITLITILAIIIVGFYFIYFHSRVSNNNDDWGTFGEYIGGVIGTIFNITAVILIYYSYKNSNLQQFELTFFNLLSNQRDIVKCLSGELYDEEVKKFVQKAGYDFLFLFSKNLETEIKKAPNSTDLKEQKVFIQKVYDGNYVLRTSLEHYYRHFYHLIKYTDESLVVNPRKYTAIIQSQMTDSELYCSFYHAISECDNNKFLALLDKYGFFENINSRNKIFDVHNKLFFQNT